MKKLLALVLSVIMLFSVMPVAYAAPKEYVEQYHDIWVRIASYDENTYESDDNGYDAVLDIIEGPYDEFLSLGYELPEPLYYNVERIDTTACIEFNRIMQPAIDEVEAKIESGEIKVLINTYEFLKHHYGFTLHYDIEEAERIGDKGYFLNNPTYAEMYNKCVNFDFDSNGYATQAEYDAGWKENVVPYIEMMKGCLDGNHPYGEYISNNDATEEADGTKTATCEFCGATDTVVDEGSKLVKEEESLSFFARLIALIKEFFAKILSIFG